MAAAEETPVAAVATEADVDADDALGAAVAVAARRSAITCRVMTSSKRRLR